MDESSKVAITTVIGAVAGALFGYLYLTEDGRRLRGEIEPRIDDFIREIRSLRGTLEKARAAANEWWQSLNDLTGSSSRWEPAARAQH